MSDSSAPCAPHTCVHIQPPPASWAAADRAGAGAAGCGRGMRESVWVVDQVQGACYRHWWPGNEIARVDGHASGARTGSINPMLQKQTPTTTVTNSRPPQRCHCGYRGRVGTTYMPCRMLQCVRSLTCPTECVSGAHHCRHAPSDPDPQQACSPAIRCTELFSPHRARTYLPYVRRRILPASPLTPPQPKPIFELTEGWS